MEEKPSILDIVADPSTSDPLSEVTRRERKALLASATVGLAISAGGLVPETISTFGITVTPKQEESLLFILAGVIGYFLIAFSIYAWSDLKRRDVQREKAREKLRPTLNDVMANSRRIEDQVKTAAPVDTAEIMEGPEYRQIATMAEQFNFTKGVERTSTLRVLFDVYFPVVVGVPSIVVVWSSTGGFPGWQLVGAGALATTLALSLLVTIWKRRDIYRAIRKKLLDRRLKRAKALSRKAERLADGHPKKAKLMTKSAWLLNKSAEDFRDGIY